MGRSKPCLDKWNFLSESWEINKRGRFCDWATHPERSVKLCTLTHSMYTVTHCSDFRIHRIVINFFSECHVQIFKSRKSDQKCASRIFVLNRSEEFRRKILRKKGGSGWRVLEMSSQSIWFQSYSIGNSWSVGLPQFVGKPKFQKCLLGCGNVCFYFSLFLLPHLICFLRLCSYTLRHLF